MINKMKLLLIVNPNAGRMKANSTLLELVSGFSEWGYQVTVYPTTKKSDAEEQVVRYSKDYDLVVCYGGDGTLSEIVSGVAKLDNPPPFGFVPAGTANDFAATVAMPTDIASAVKKIAAGKNRPLDIGRFDAYKSQPCSQNFIYVAAFGLFTSVSYTVTQDMKKAFGHFSYVMEGIKQAMDVPSHRIKVEYNNKVVKDEFVVGLVTNSTSVAGMFKLERSKVKLDDGKFELILIRNPGSVALLSQIFMDLSQRKYDPDYVIFERVSRVNFHCEQPVAWCLDGENGGVHKNVAITNLHKRGVIRL